MDQDCNIKIGEEIHQGLEAARLLAGVRDRLRVEICYQGCSDIDRRMIMAIYQKWRQDSNLWQRYRLAVYAGLAALLLVLAYAGGLLDQALQVFTTAAPPSGAEDSDSLFADKASMHVFLGTIAVILAVVVVFLRRLGHKAAQEQAGGVRLKDTELTRLLAKGYTLGLAEGKLT